MIEPNETGRQANRFAITQEQIHVAYKKVKANAGAAGIDRQSLSMYEQNAEKENYKLWNRMSSGSYMASPVLRVAIPKGDGKERILGIPTVLDRIAQQVVADVITPRLEEVFSDNSYGYRPQRSAHQALAKCKQNCFRKSWAIDLDIKGFFDNIPHDKLMEMVELHVSEKWILLYVLRWLKAPMQDKEGNEEARDKGTPQGGVISPILANLYLHYVLDSWLESSPYRSVPYERYADDVILHCDHLEEAEALLEAIRQRMAEYGLALHPEKTKIIYCKDERRKGNHTHIMFTFLGHDFKPRTCVDPKTGRIFWGFTPGVSKKAQKAIVEAMFEQRWDRWTQWELEQIAKLLNPKISGWLNYYGPMRMSALYGVFRILNQHLVKWITRKYKGYRRRRGKAWQRLKELAQTNPNLFRHWQAGFTS